MVSCGRVDHIERTCRCRTGARCAATRSGGDGRLARLCRRRAADQYREPRADPAAVLRAAAIMPDLVGNRQSARRVGGGTGAGALGRTARVQRAGRSEERREGKEGVGPWRSRWWPDQYKKKK